MMMKDEILRALCNKWLNTAQLHQSTAESLEKSNEMGATSLRAKAVQLKQCAEDVASMMRVLGDE